MNFDRSLDSMTVFARILIALMCILAVLCLWLSATVYEQRQDITGLQLWVDNLTVYNGELTGNWLMQIQKRIPVLIFLMYATKIMKPW